MPCATETSAGTGGKANERNTPTTWNAFRQFRQTWDGRGATVEDLVVPHVLEASTHGLADEAQLVAKIKEKAELADGFKKAFPGGADPVTAANFKLALGVFLRTLATKSKWEEFIDGNQRAFSNEEVLGLKTFVELGCTTCHATRLVGGHMYQKLGLLKPYSSHDVGRMAVTKTASDESFFKVPLRPWRIVAFLSLAIVAYTSATYLWVPIRRVVGPADIAAIAVHLMTNGAVTGATFDIDGGQQLVEQ